MSPRYEIVAGDCDSVLPSLDGGYHACLCDPPYGLDFMGSKWDGAVPPASTWRMVLDLLKPGATLVAFGGTRTYHRLACAIEDAGFQIRDSILLVSSPREKARRLLDSLSEEQAELLLELLGGDGLMAWAYGTGMPKNFNISKAFDDAAGVVGKVVGRYKPPRMAKDWRLSKVSDKRTVDIFASSRKNLEIRAPGSQLGEKWDGYGTALKPVWEPIVVAMKPLEGGYCSNAEAHGVAGVNIDGSRLPLHAGETAGDGEYAKRKSGRWPTNMIVTHDPGCSNDECVEGCPVPLVKSLGGDGLGMSRFVYCPKPSLNERNAGLPDGVRNEHPTLKPICVAKALAKMLLPPEGQKRRLLVPFSGSGSEMIGGLLAGWDFVTGVEREPNFAEVSRMRIEHWLGGGLANEAHEANPGAEEGLFDIG